MARLSPVSTEWQGAPLQKCGAVAACQSRARRPRLPRCAVGGMVQAARGAGAGSANGRRFSQAQQQRACRGVPPARRPTADAPQAGGAAGGPRLTAAILCPPLRWQARGSAPGASSSGAGRSTTQLPLPAGRARAPAQDPGALELHNYWDSLADQPEEDTRSVGEASPQLTVHQGVVTRDAWGVSSCCCVAPRRVSACGLDCSCRCQQAAAPTRCPEAHDRRRQAA